MKRIPFALGIVLCLCGDILGRVGGEVPVTLTTRVGRLSVTPAGDSVLPMPSGDGRVVAFESGARNLVGNDANQGTVDVFVREIASKRTWLASVSTNGTSGNGTSHLAGISRDGKRVLFSSRATDLVPGDANDAVDFFVSNPETGVVTLVSANTNGASGSHGASGAYMTPDGRFVIFESKSSDLTDRDLNGDSDVFVRDLENGTTRRISVPSPEATIAGRATGESFYGRVSDDGSTVVFRSYALNLTPFISTRDGAMINDLYYLRPPATTNRMVDVFGGASASPRPGLYVPAFDLSPDGRYLAFFQDTSSPRVIRKGIYRVDLDTGEYQLVTDGLTGFLDNYSLEQLSPVLSSDARTIVFEVREPVSAGASSLDAVVYAWNATTQERTVVSSGGWVTNSTGALEESRFGSLLGTSRDGNFVAFLGGSIHDPPNVPTRQIVVRNRTTGEVRRVSRTRTGAPVDALDYPSLSFSDDGKRLAFQSASPALVLDDLNRAWDVFLYDWDSNTVSLISSADLALRTATAFGDVILGPAGLSGDGRFLAFLSSADGLAAGHRSGVRDAYRMDRRSGNLDRVSVSAIGDGPEFSSAEPAISRDGRFVAFTSAAENLVLVDTNQVRDVFLRDMVDETTILVSRGLNGRSVSGGASAPALSPDGQWIAFVSSSPDLSALPVGTQPQVYLFHRPSEKLKLVSVAASGKTSGNGASMQPTFSPDGRWLMFESRAPDLLARSTGTGRSVYAYRLEDGALRRVATPSLAAIGGSLPGPSPAAVFSPEGRFAATLLATSDVTELNVYLHAFETGSTTRLLGPAMGVALAADASRVAYRTLSSMASEASQIRVLDRVTGVDRVVSAAEDGTPGNGSCSSPLITPDGRWVAFASRASNLVVGDHNGLSDVFLKDLDSGRMIRLGGNSLSTAPVLSADGRTLIFRSFSDDLAKADYNGASDLFAAALPGPESGYRITAVTRLSTGHLRLVWPVVAGKTYRVHEASDPAGPWRDSGLAVTLEGSQGSAEVPAEEPAIRFFRLEER